MRFIVLGFSTRSFIVKWVFMCAIFSRRFAFLHATLALSALFAFGCGSVDLHDIIYSRIQQYLCVSGFYTKIICLLVGLLCMRGRARRNWKLLCRKKNSEYESQMKQRVMRSYFRYVKWLNPLKYLWICYVCLFCWFFFSIFRSPSVPLICSDPWMQYALVQV